jgi:GntR family transcriptional regulator/MocR family aminotransferase
LLIRLEPGGGGTLQDQICAGVRRAVLDGVLRPGSRLPSSRALAAELGVSRTTALLAFEQLLAEGYLESRRGSGTFVASELPDGSIQYLGARRASPPSHPPLSSRASALAAIRPSADRIQGPPRAFRLGTPALDLFPMRVWSQLASRRLRRATVSQLDYGHAAGLPALREAIASHVSSSRGTRCDADQVFIVAGAQRGLDLMAGLLLEPGDRAWLENPAFPGVHSALLRAGAQVVPVPVDADGIDVETGRRVAPRARVAYVTPSHQFPTGALLSLPRRLALLQWASAADAWIVEDDYDSEFRYDGRPLPCLHGIDPDGRVIYVGSFSKSLFPALRLGFLIVPPDLHAPLRAVRRVGDMHPPMLDQMILADFIAGGHFDRHVRRSRTACAERLGALIDAAGRYCGGALRVRPVRTGLHAVADLDGVDATEVARRALANGVELKALRDFAIAPVPDTNAVVMGFAAVHPAAIELGMERLARAIEEARRAPQTYRRARSA